MPYKDKEFGRQHHNQYYHKNKEQISQQRKERWKIEGKEIVKQKRMTLFELVGSYECARCGFSDIRALQIDHINGGGSRDRKRDKTSHSCLMKDIKNRPEDFQILCANCNWIKRVENNEVGRFRFKENPNPSPENKNRTLFDY